MAQDRADAVRVLAAFERVEAQNATIIGRMT